MIQKYTEIYYDDAVRFAQYIQANYGGEIELVKEDAEGFPLPPKHKMFGVMVDCLKVGNYEIAYFEQRKNPDDDKKHRNRNLYRFIMGQKIKEVRELSGMTLEELSERSGYKAGNLRNIELGKYNADIDTLCNIVEAMDAHFEVMKD